MDLMPKPTAYEDLARQRKATALADCASRYQYTADEVANIETIRERLVLLTGVRNPSQATWQLVVSSLVARERNPQ